MHRNHRTSSLFMAASVIALVAARPGAAGLAVSQGEPSVVSTSSGPIAAFLHCLGVVDLTDQQKADAKTIFETAKPVLQGLVGQLAADGTSLKALLQATPKDPCAIGTALLKVTADEKALKDELVSIGTSLEALLTAEQKAKFQGCMAGTRGAAASGAAGQ